MITVNPSSFGCFTGPMRRYPDSTGNAIYAVATLQELHP